MRNTNCPGECERRRAGPAGALAGLLLVVLAGPCKALDPEQTIRVALIGDVRSSWPGVQRDSNSDDVLQHVVESLVAHRGDLGVAPMAAESFEASPDFRSYRFTLREGLLFHNREPVVAQHVVLNWQKVLDPQTGFQCLPFYDGTIGARVVSVEAEDDRTVTIKLDRPNPLFLEMLANVQCPVAVLHPESWDTDGRWRSPVGTGPFRFSQWNKGRFVLLERFEEYRPRSEPASGLAGRKHACVDYIRWMTITDPLAAHAAVVSGQVDLSYAVAPVSAKEMERNDSVRVLQQPGAGRQVILMQSADPLLAGVGIRRAIAHALDLDLFAHIATLGIAEANPSAVPGSNPAHTGVHGDWVEYDPEAAAALLDQSGYDGRPLVIKTTRATQLLFDAAIIAQAMLSDAGFDVRVEVMEWSALIAAYFDGNYQLMTFEYSPRLTPFMSYQAIIGTENQSSYLWNDRLAARLLMTAAQEPDRERRFATFESIHRRMIEQVPMINLFNLPIIDVASRRIAGYRTWTGGTPRLWNVCLRGSKR